ncbi:hypothetical protein DAMA08_008450 [Martiniozyma asiatica (nom. inval.)]|nr:hypothetical protein DAMA08_008450 [Martiniozyma asiatica]
MDISIGSYDSKQSFPKRIGGIYSRLTKKGKALLAFLFVLLLFFLWPSGSKDPIHPDSFSRDSLTDDIQDVEIDGASISGILNTSPGVKSLGLSYLSLPPLITQSGLQNYVNGGNMLLSLRSPFVRLTKDAPHMHGYINSKSQISHSDSSALEVELNFKIHGIRQSNLIGDGLALWLTSDKLQSGDVFGVQGAWDGLGIFVDTYKNYNGRKNRNNWPYISVQRNRGDSEYYDKNTDGINTQLIGCSWRDIYEQAENDNLEGSVKGLKVIYLRDTGVLEILVNNDIENDNWRVCLRKEDAFELLPNRDVYVGASAETGELHHAVDVYGLNVKTWRKENGETITNLDDLAGGKPFRD